MVRAIRNEEDDMPTDKNKIDRLSVSMPADLIARVREHAKKTRRTVSSLLTEWVLQKQSQRAAK